MTDPSLRLIRQELLPGEVIYSFFFVLTIVTYIIVFLPLISYNIVRTNSRETTMFTGGSHQHGAKVERWEDLSPREPGGSR